MVGDAQFTFRGTRLTRYTVTVGSTGIRIAYVTPMEGASRQYSSSREIAFASIRSATVCEWQAGQRGGEATYLHSAPGGTAMFMSSPVWAGEGRVQTRDRAMYLAASAAVFEALAAARPDLRVRNGRPRAWKMRRGVYLALFAPAVSGLFLWLTDGQAPDALRYTAVAVILAMAVFHGVYRQRLLSRPGDA